MGLFDIFGRNDTVYFPGCINYFKFKEGFEVYQEIFSKLGIRFRILEKQISCGLEALEAGYDNEARKLARKNLDLFNELGVRRVVTTSPGCYKMFLKDYPNILPDWNLIVVDLWELILERLRKKYYLIKNKKMEVVTYHDPCYLGRYCQVYDSPRKILELIGYEIKEMDNSRENSFCCGSCGGLPIVNPRLADKIARERILQAKRIGVKKMIVIGFDNYSLLKKNVGDMGIEILEFSEVLAHSLGIKEFEPVEERIEGEERILLETKANIRLQEEFKEEDYYDDFKEDEWK